MDATRNEAPLVARTFALGAALTVLATAQDLRQLDSSGHVAAVYDPIRERIMALGRHGTTETFLGGRWLQRPESMIDADSEIEFAFDRRRGRTVAVRAAWPVLDTLVHDGVSWRDANSPVRPSSRYVWAMAFDEVREEVVLYGGVDAATYASIGDTWLFDGNSWTQAMPATVPQSRGGTALVFDSARGRCLMFGGVSGPTLSPGAVVLSDTWVWNGTDWRQLAPSTAPPPRTAMAAVYDRSRDRVVLVGGFDYAQYVEDVWEFDGVTWSDVTPPPPRPRRRTDVPFVYDERSEGCVLVGAGPHGLETWAWNGARWQLVTAIEQPTFRHSRMTAPGSSGDRVVMLETPHYLSDVHRTWVWEGAWSLAPNGDIPARSGGRLVPGATHTYCYGGGLGANRSELWGFDGVSWTLLAPSGPVANGSGILGFDWARGELVLFGGSNNAGLLADTWVFDGASWQQRNPATSPPARSDGWMAFDVVRGKLVMVSGLLHDDMWEWDGVRWTRVPGALPTAQPHGLAFDVDRGELVLAARTAGGTQAWSFDGQVWSPISVAGAEVINNGLELFGWPFVDGLLVSSGISLFGIRAGAPSVEHYGSECTPAAARLSAREWPRLGSSSFAFEVTTEGSMEPFALAFGTAPSSSTLGGCTVLVQPGSGPVVFGVSTGQGFGLVPTAIAVDPALAGLEVFLQVGTLDPNAGRGISLSEGLRITVGR